MILLAMMAAGLTTAPLAPDDIHVALSGTVRIERPGTTAAYAVDVDIVEASLGPTHVALLGRGPGTTRVTVVGAGGIETWNVTVDAPPSTVVAHRSDARRTATWSEHYDSETSRVTTTLHVEMLTRRGWPIRFQAVNLTKARDTSDGFARSAFPLASLSFGTPRRGFILGDEMVTRSPLTLDGTLLRGAHLRAGGLEAHAGFASALIYGSLFVPAQRETALGASYRFGTDSFHVSPSLYAFPDAAKVRPGARSLLPGLLVEKEGKNGLFLLGEVGWSDGVAAAAEANYDTPAHRLHGRVRYQPIALPALSLGHPQGTFGDLSWSWRVLSRLGLTLAGAAAQYDDPRASQRTAGATADLAWSIARHWSARSGVGVGRYDAEGAPRVETLSIPAGLAFDDGRFGLSALYRYQTNSATNRGGNGGRLSAHVGGGRLRLSTYADYQRDAPTLSLLLRDYPEVARALAEQGLVARTPEDIARLIDASALLVGSDGPGAVRITLDPSRAQAGFDLTWTGRRTQVRLHGLADRTEAASRRQDTRLATLSLTQRIASTELTASYTRWQSDIAAFGSAGGAFQVGFRQWLSGGEPGSSRQARIVGHVYREEGTATMTVGVPGVTVRLGDGRTAITDAGGSFVFDRVGKRGRRVEALLPAPNAFYTTPSVVEVKDSAVVSFGLRFSDGRLDGRVQDDAGQPVAGVTLRLTGTGGILTTVSGSTGRYVFNTAEGDYVLRPDPGSLPTGYEVVAPETHDVAVSLAAPTHTDIAVRAQRSISGRLATPRAGIDVRLRAADRAVQSDEQGRFLFRHVAAGPDIVEAMVDGRVTSRAVLVPEEPAILRDIALDDSAPIAPAPGRLRRTATASRGASYGVQVASFPDRAVAEATASRLTAAGGPASQVFRVDLGARGVWHRVIVIGFVDAEAARAYRERILDEGREAGPVFRLAPPEQGP